MSSTEKLFRRLDELEGEYLKLAAADLKQYLRGALSLIHCSLFPDTFLAHRLDRNEVERFRWVEKEIEALRLKLDQPISESPVGQMRKLLHQLREEKRSGNGLEYPLVKELLKRWGHDDATAR